MTEHILSRRTFIKGGVAVGFSFTALGQLVGCGGEGGEPSSGESRDRLTVLFNDAPTSFDPVVGWDGWYTVCRGITETLVQFDHEMNVQPCLATSWVMDDPYTWRFTLRGDVVFHTGTPLTPQRAKASIERCIAHNDRAADKIRVESITVEGNDLVIRSTQTIATMPGELAEPVFSILDTDTADEAPETSGTGPFMGKEMTAVENFILTRFDGYWGGTAQVTELHNQTVTEPSVRTIALQSGDTDVAWSIQASDVPLFEQDARFRVEQSESVRMVFAFLNYRNPHLAHQEVRQALSNAIDRASICDKLLNGTLLTNGTLFPRYLSYSQAVSDVEQHFDVEEAEALLTAAGYTRTDEAWEKDGERLRLRLAYYASRPELPVIAQAVQDQLRTVGIEVEIQLFENVADLFGTADFDIMLYNTTTVGNGDPSYYLGLYYATDGSENAHGYSNPTVDAIVDDMRQELDQERRFALAEEAQRLILADCPCLYFGSPIMNLVCTADTQGFALYPVEYYGVTNEIR